MFCRGYGIGKQWVLDFSQKLCTLQGVFGDLVGDLVGDLLVFVERGGEQTTTLLQPRGPRSAT